MVRWWWPWLVLSWACTVKPPPGEPMGVYVMTATPIERRCELEDVVANDFSFEATLTRQPDSTQGWLTLNGYTRDAVFDGATFFSTGTASRVFTRCSDCAARVVETFTVAVLSRSQSEAVGQQCPPNALDGGVPQPNDAGIWPPQQLPLGFDAVRLCGELVTSVEADGLADGGSCDAVCGACQVRYVLVGDRR